MTRAFCAVLVMAWLGCGTEDPPTGETLTYVVSTMHDPPAGPMRVVGFDLDGQVSAGASDACDDQADQGAGIDNNLARVERGSVLDPLWWTRTVEQAIVDGEYLLVLEVSDVDSIEEDASVGVRLYLARALGPIEVDEGRVAPGQTFEQLGADLATLAVGEVAIEDGFLEFRSPTLPMPERGAPLVLHDAHVRARITPTGLTEGVLGGAVLLTELVPPDSSITLEEVQASGYPDLQPDPGDSSICHAISAGFTFEAVSAVGE